MRLNYNFAFKNSKLRPWQRPAAPNLLTTDASLQKKLVYIIDQFNKNSELFYPPTLILGLSLGLQVFSIYPNKILKSFEESHIEYTKVNGKLSSLNSFKQKFNRNINNLEPYFTQATTSYLFAYYLQRSVPKGVKLKNYAYSDNGFEINISAFSIDSLNEFLTLIIESPIVNKNTVNISQLNKQILAKSETNPIDFNYDLLLYGESNKLGAKKREYFYNESGADGLYKKFQRFKYIKYLLRK